jgi:hypothetical protein
MMEREMTMVERVAREMAAKEGWRWDDERQMLDCAAAGLQNTNRERDTWRRRAETAIGAMRENTPAMSEAMRMANMNIAGGYGGPSGWEAAIDAALKEHEG